LLAADGLPARDSGEWAKDKLHYLNRYCGIVSKALGSGYLALIYLDVMAGPGVCKVEETGEEFPGSPFIALNHNFRRYIFIESDPTMGAALEARVKAYPKAGQVKVFKEPWQDVLSSGRLKFNESQLVLAFVDPTGISQVPMKDMLALASNPRIDLLVTIQHKMSVSWNFHQYAKKKTGDTALDRFLGHSRWHEWSNHSAGEFTRNVIDDYSATIKAQGFRVTRHISVPESNPIYRMTLFSRHLLGEDFWDKSTSVNQSGQKELI
jgi:three-Cys-motif partner protein